MRLTLRTLLAYLDDTLEPLEIKTIGQKVAESETAQELIARIKQVTRRRRITTPPATGPNSFDPNMVAEYLDSQLSSEQVAELEKICLESDVHLAEVASCHQILTLVLGEPAAVPPTAKERMYGLVRGREAIPFRKAAAAAGNDSSSSAHSDADEMFLLGLPFYRRGSWLRWALPLAAVVLFAIVGVALWHSIPDFNALNHSPQVAQGSKPNPETTENTDKEKSNSPEKGNPTTVKPLEETPKNPDKAPPQPAEVKPTPPTPPKENRPADTTKPDKKVPAEKQPEKKPEKTPEQPAAVEVTHRDAPANTERVKIGTYVTPDFKPPSLLLARDKNNEWQKVKAGSDVYSHDEIMSLPGYASEVRLPCGIHLLLRGHLREFTPQVEGAGLMDHLRECALVLNKPLKGTDADITLDRGRLFLSNPNEPKSRVVRLRFGNKQVWDITLDPEAEVVVDLFKHQRNNIPISTLNVCPIHGTFGLAVGYDSYPRLSVPGRSLFLWDSVHPAGEYGREMITKQWHDEAINTLYAKTPSAKLPYVAEMTRALKALHQWMTANSPLVACKQVLQKPGRELPYEHHLVLDCLGSLDEIEEVLNVLKKDNAADAPDREVAIVVLRRWLDRGPEQDDKLFDSKTNKGLLTKMSMPTDDAKRIVELLHDPNAEQVFSSREFYESLAQDLVSSNVAIAELARWWLLKLVGMWQKAIPDLKTPRLKTFNAATPIEQRRAAMEEVMARIHEGLLPPPEPGKQQQPNAGGRPNPKSGSGTKSDPRPKK